MMSEMPRRTGIAWMTRRRMYLIIDSSPLRHGHGWIPSTVGERAAGPQRPAALPSRSVVRRAYSESHQSPMFHWPDAVDGLPVKLLDLRAHQPDVLALETAAARRCSGPSRRCPGSSPIASRDLGEVDARCGRCHRPRRAPGARSGSRSGRCAAGCPGSRTSGRRCSRRAGRAARCSRASTTS